MGYLPIPKTGVRLSSSAWHGILTGNFGYDSAVNPGHPDRGTDICSLHALRIDFVSNYDPAARVSAVYTLRVIHYRGRLRGRLCDLVPHGAIFVSGEESQLTLSIGTGNGCLAVSISV